MDLLDRPAVQKALESLNPSVVVHLAAISFVAHGDADAIYRVNIVGTRNLLEALAALERKPARVLLVSSANIYGNAGGVVAEDTLAQPQNDYAVSKLAMEHMAQLWSERLPITIVRPFNYTGVGQADKFLLPKIVDHFRRKASVMELGNLDVSRDFNDVRNVAQMYRRLLAVDAAGEIFNVCSGRQYSLREVVAIMEDISGHRLEVRVNPAFVRVNEVRELRGNPDKLASHIGVLPEFSLRATLSWMYEQS
ncbi:NAD dependent epimerase/dehydratase family protein [Lysobacter antibioticus]|nr:NAD dependent epimerase/dehydratase family protein [Lysobacter antibioticus]